MEARGPRSARWMLAEARHRAIPFVNDVRLRAEAWRPGHLAHCGKWFVLDRASRYNYRILSEEELRATRRSDTVFIFGSGKSLLDTTAKEWERIAHHDTIGFNQFHKQRWVRVDYHLIAEVIDPKTYTRSIIDNPYYAHSIFCIQEGLLAQRGNEIVGQRLLPHGSRIFRFRRKWVGRYSPPSRSFADGVVHYANTSLNATNFALLVGWKRVVLVGVDLYDKEYFWLPTGGLIPGDSRGPANMKFPNADRIVETFARWRPIVEAAGAEILVYNPQSLLAGPLEVFSWDRVPAVAAAQATPP